jgi:hypothetical protein
MNQRVFSCQKTRLWLRGFYAPPLYLMLALANWVSTFLLTFDDLRFDKPDPGIVGVNRHYHTKQIPPVCYITETVSPLFEQVTVIGP